MTFRTTIGSKHKPKDFLKRGFKSMFTNYGTESGEEHKTPPVDTEKKSTTSDR